MPSLQDVEEHFALRVGALLVVFADDPARVEGVRTYLVLLKHWARLTPQVGAARRALADALGPDLPCVRAFVAADEAIDTWLLEGMADAYDRLGNA